MGHMQHREAHLSVDSDDGEFEITQAAVAGYARLRRMVGGRLTTHPFGDGGLICELRRGRARSTLWRVAADGTVISDTPYSYAQRAFVVAPPVSGLAVVPELNAETSPGRQGAGRRISRRGV